MCIILWKPQRHTCVHPDHLSSTPPCAGSTPSVADNALAARLIHQHIINLDTLDKGGCRCNHYSVIPITALVHW